MKPLWRVCRECDGAGGWYPIIGEGRTRLGYPYPIEGPWEECQECDEAGRILDDNKIGTSPAPEEGEPT